ncbi:MAG: hypothetical protein ABIO77_02185 [Ginsengibacter sp.]
MNLGALKLINLFLRQLKTISLFEKIKNWEQWPFQVLYAPIAPVWGWYMLRSGSVWFFTPSNPRLTFGGMEGEPKREMHLLLPPHLCPVFFNVKPSDDFELVLQKLEEKKIQLPFIVKPEVGGQGILFRKIETLEQLKFYHSKVPAEYFIQEFIDYPIEVSLFYYRHPTEEHGTISGFLQKIPLHVIGDGIHTLAELLRINTKAKKRMDELRTKHESNFNVVLAEGQKYMLSYAGNHNRGAKFIDISGEKDERLLNFLDEISKKNDFFYGRYDIMCHSIDEMKEGKNFVILEYNGCGAEPNHFYDTDYTLLNAYKEILKHWKVLYQISKYNKEHGIEYWPLWKGVRFLSKTKKYLKKIKAADKIIPQDFSLI